MEVAGTRSWQISEDRWPEVFEVALWFRAAERIDVPAGGVVPGPAGIDALPDRSAAPAGMSELAAGWLAWWQALAGQFPLREPLDSTQAMTSPMATLASDPAATRYSPPDQPAASPSAAAATVSEAPRISPVRLMSSAVSLASVRQAVEAMMRVRQPATTSAISARAQATGTAVRVGIKPMRA